MARSARPSRQGPFFTPDRSPQGRDPTRGSAHEGRIRSKLTSTPGIGATHSRERHDNRPPRPIFVLQMPRRQQDRCVNLSTRVTACHRMSVQVAPRRNERQNERPSTPQQIAIRSSDRPTRRRLPSGLHLDRDASNQQHITLRRRRANTVIRPHIRTRRSSCPCANPRSSNQLAAWIRFRHH